jgi:uncharacterized protein YqhQ
VANPERVGERIKVGGQALPDGVMMRTNRAWAVARADGTITTGSVAPVRFENVPLLRVVMGLGQAVRLGLGSATGGIRRRSPSWPLIRALLLTEATAALFTWAIAAAHVSLGGRWTSGIAVWTVAITVFRLTSPTSQWRYHGAEHKAVTAYERGVALDDVGAVLTCPRVHPRCGTNLMVWLAVATPILGALPWPVQPFGFILVVAAAAETLTLAGKRPKSLAARLVLVPGAALQWFVTTREPTPAEQLVGCRALQACLDRHRQSDVSSSGQRQAA